MGNLKQHLINLHGIDWERVHEFVNHISMSEFEEKHELEKTNKCTKCLVEGCTFVSKTNSGIIQHVVKIHKFPHTEAYKYFKSISKEEYEEMSQGLFCEFCKKSFAKFSYYANHKTRIHGDFDPSVAKFECQDCKVRPTLLYPPYKKFFENNF